MLLPKTIIIELILVEIILRLGSLNEFVVIIIIKTIAIKLCVGIVGKVVRRGSGEGLRKVVVSCGSKVIVVLHRLGMLLLLLEWRADQLDQLLKDPRGARDGRGDRGTREPFKFRRRRDEPVLQRLLSIPDGGRVTNGRLHDHVFDIPGRRRF